MDWALRSKIAVDDTVFSSAGFAAAGLPYDNDYMNKASTQKALQPLNTRLSLRDVPVGPNTGVVSLHTGYKSFPVVEIAQGMSAPMPGHVERALE
ncbi:MAG: hypothetical protein E2586_02570 [Novosphingobium sp.]|uniref:hypothetical protein n=1 Tax=Novosphingobium sp. TaxID=1874826 RepID=UPI0012CFB9A4|nr:hypothetical protein [Novosphingobium sp.]MPS67366.1 hypothetical protein [Novosphingobium sp.]